MTHTPRRLALLALVVVAAGALSVSFGASGLGPADLWRFFLGEADPTTRSILLQLRLPRAALAALVGGALGLCGCTFQALLRNPLAEPYVLGVSGGAAVGAVAVVVTGIGLRLPWSLPLGAFAGALAAMALVLAVARRASPGRMDTRVLILSGVIIGAFFNAVILLLLSIADVESFRSAIFWMMGNLSGADWGSTGLLALLLVPAALAVFSLARAFNVLSRGEEVAFYLGASVQRVKLTAYLAASLMVAAAVAAGGVIGFVGLIVPHAVRLAWGNDHRLLLPASFLAGTAFLLLADTVARLVLAPAELPTGVVTAVAGVPFFVALLLRGGRR
ncbi:MAG: iron ABC transporter permease [Gemmatimonadales bacterium]|uniref:FecCD family ABC transporter permease n=1 Tax=Candidatus Palauibacter irciniicola TaxID=3056733 RepID=UPI001384DA33|nr:iron ABC transporter permease [Candidatus Palauibacter irciniicola]MYC17032.1 iron ABC transporter permease [Gemmatimonadales bacterium]